MEYRKVLAICGSTKKVSSSLALIEIIRDLSHGEMEIELYKGIENLPHYNQDIDSTNPPEEVLNFRQAIHLNQALLIVTPEYAFGPPGSLKNAIDWTVTSMSLSKKPAALITAALMGEKTHKSLLETLKVLECDIKEETQLRIPFIKTVVPDDKTIKNEKVLIEVKSLIHSLIKTIDESVQIRKMEE